MSLDRAIGPVPASRLALKRAGLSLDEAFAAQYLACEEELGLDREKVNVNGGAVAFGHPVGASGARILLTLLYELKRREKRYGFAMHRRRPGHRDGRRVDLEMQNCCPGGEPWGSPSFSKESKNVSTA